MAGKKVKQEESTGQFTSHELEDAFEKLNQIVEALEKPDVSLEDSFGLYQEGMKLLKTCNDSIDKVEKNLIILNENGEANEV